MNELSLESLLAPERELLAQALEARAAAWCPYSDFAVGAALRLADGRSFAACNVENASYGLSICAERAAVFAAVAAGLRPGELQLVALVGGPLSSESGRALPSITPCGACRQVLMEFAAHDCEVICAGAAGSQEPGGMVALTGIQRYRLRELLPHAFHLG